VKRRSVLTAHQYFQNLHNCVNPVVDPVTVSLRYQPVQNQIVGTTVAQTSGCWLSHPTIDFSKRYHTVLATDEYFTYATLHTQQQLIESVIACTQQRLVITVRDFKNANRYEPSVRWALSHPDHSVIINESARPVDEDRQSWLHDTYVINHLHGHRPTVQHVGTVTRRAVYFKQMAKFCFDAGCTSFRVVPNILFKPIFKSHVEHVVVVDW